jgi:lipopolysaccharide biosynthesis protein
MADASAVRALAFYLPQYHPIPENDLWWGRGFTDWLNVARARPLFEDHAQPHLPTDLGFYDLRLSDARAGQAELAARYGVHGFCYYHYWFEGRQLLERPFREVLHSKDPALPFALCWANENWTRVWTGGNREVLLAQTYSDADDLSHIRWLAQAFADPRYIRVDDRPLFLVYRPSSLPNAARTADVWRAEATRLGVGDLYLCAVHSNTTLRQDPAVIGFDAAVEFQPYFDELPNRAGQSVMARGIAKVFRPDSPYRIHRIHEYEDMIANSLRRPVPPWVQYPCVTPGFDNSPRRARGGAVILRGSTPQAYGEWVREAVRQFTPRTSDENFIFVNAWNEWAEGNHLEPCERWGRAYLEAHGAVCRPEHATGAPGEPAFSAGATTDTNSNLSR